MEPFPLKSSSGVEYHVAVRPRGWSYAVPVIYERRKRFKLFPYWSPIWSGNAKSIINADKMLPEPKERWCIETLDEYETYEAAWRNHEQTLKL